VDERERARKALSRIPPSAVGRLEGAVQAFVAAEIGQPTPELLQYAAEVFEARTSALRIMEAAVAHLFAAILRRRAEELRAATAQPPPAPPPPRNVRAA
jgi:hypothetical protein